MSKVSLTNSISFSRTNEITVVKSRFQNKASCLSSFYGRALREKIAAVWNKFISCILAFLFCEKKEAKPSNNSGPKPLDPPKKPENSPKPSNPPEPKNPPKPIPFKKDSPSKPFLLLPPKGEEGKSAPSSKFNTLGGDVTAKMLTFLSAKDILSFERASKGSQAIVKREPLWKYLIARDLKQDKIPKSEKVVSKRTYQSLAEKVAYVGLTIRTSFEDYLPFTYRAGVTTMGDLKRKISNKTGIPLDQMKFQNIGWAGWKEGKFVGGASLFMPDFYGEKEGDHTLCSDAMFRYTKSKPEDFKPEGLPYVHLTFSLDRDPQKK